MAGRDGPFKAALEGGCTNAIGPNPYGKERVCLISMLIVAGISNPDAAWQSLILSKGHLSSLNNQIDA